MESALQQRASPVGDGDGRSVFEEACADPEAAASFSVVDPDDMKHGQVEGEEPRGDAPMSLGADGSRKALKAPLLEAVPKFELDAPPKEAAPTKRQILFGTLLYALCSSTLLVVNKVTLNLIPDTPFLLICQYIVSAVSMRALGAARPDIEVEGLVMEKVKPFSIAVCVVFAVLLTNAEALKAVNVESVIVVRSCSPIAVALLESATLGKALPSRSGMGMLATIAIGAFLYVVTDAGFVINGYLWLVLYFVSIVVDMVYIKFVMENIKMSTWTRVYYTSALSLPLAMCCWLVLGSSSTLSCLASPRAQASLLLACVLGVGIGYAGYSLRQMLSATSFTVVGVVCKLGTVLINDVIWNKHSSFFGHVTLALCIAAGLAYEKLK